MPDHRRIVSVCLLVLCLAMAAHTQLDPWQQGLDFGRQALREQRYPEAKPWLLTALHEAETFPPGDPRLNEVLVALAGLYRASAPAAGETFFRDLRARWARQWGEDDARVASCLVALAELLRHEPYVPADDAALVPLYTRAQQIREQVYGEDAPCLVETLERLAFLDARAGRADMAVARYTRAIEIKRLAGEEDSELAALCFALAEVHWSRARFAEAAAAWEDALARYTALDPHAARAAVTLNRLAWAYERLGRYAEMAACWERAATIRSKSEDWELLQVLGDLAMAYRLLGRLTDAEQVRLRDLAIRVRAHRATVDPGTVALAELYHRQGRLEEATARYREVIDRHDHQERFLPARSYLLACLGVGEVALAAGDREAAMPKLLLAQALVDDTFSLLPPEIDEAAVRLRLALHEYEAAAEVGEALIADDLRTYPPAHPRVADHRLLLARARAGQGKANEAAALLARALEDWTQAFGADSPALIMRLLDGAALCRALGQPAAADLLARARALAEQADTPDGWLALAREARAVGDNNALTQVCDRARAAAARYPADDIRRDSVSRQCEALQAAGKL